MNLLYLHFLPLFCSFSLSLLSRPSLSAVAQFNPFFLSNSPFSPPFPFTFTVLSRGHDLPCRSVGPSVSFLNCGRGFCFNYPCPTVRDYFAVYPVLFLSRHVSNKFSTHRLLPDRTSNPAFFSLQSLFDGFEGSATLLRGFGDSRHVVVNECGDVELQHARVFGNDVSRGAV